MLPQAYDPAYGARPLRRWLEHTIVTRLSTMIIAGHLPDDSTVTVDVAPSGGLVYAVEPKEPAGAQQSQHGELCSSGPCPYGESICCMPPTKLPAPAENYVQ
jgi:hypothetical protein